MVDHAVTRSSNTWFNRACNYAVKSLAGILYSDTKAFKSYKLETLKRVQLTSNRFEIFLETLLKALQCDGIVSRSKPCTEKKEGTKALGYKGWQPLLSRAPSVAPIPPKC
jgi:hypothetical protein